MTPIRAGPCVLTPSPLRSGRAVALGWVYRHRWPLGVIAVMLLATVIRLRFVLAVDFPLGDGGLFSIMAEEIERAHFRLPSFTSYNGGQIPFAYPPLGLYTAALLDAVLPCGLEKILRFIPPLVNTLNVGAVMLLAQTITRRRGVALLSGAVFAVYPMSYMWLIMGGGITRALGLLFAVLAVQQMHCLARGHPRSIVAAAVLAALTAMSHLEAAVFVLVSGILLLAVYGRVQDTPLRLVLAAIGAALCASPWWATVMARHGITPFWYAGQTGGGLLLLLRLPLRLLPFSLAAALLTAVLCLLWAGRHRWARALASLSERPVPLLACWIVTLALADLRAWLTYSAVPLAILAGMALLNTAVAVHAVAAVGPTRDTDPTPSPQPPTGVRPLPLAATTALAFVMFWWSALVMVHPPWELAGLAPSSRAAMRWAQEHSPASSRFLVITGSEHWEPDRVSEWFPALARRMSLATPQGQEWRPQFANAIVRYHAAQRCARSHVDCLTAWSRHTGLAFTHVYVAKPSASTAPNQGSTDCCGELRAALSSDPGYELVYDGPGASIFVRRAPAPVAGHSDQSADHVP